MILLLRLDILKISNVGDPVKLAAGAARPYHQGAGIQGLP
jgi:hypothetical protein